MFLSFFHYNLLLFPIFETPNKEQLIARYRFKNKSIGNLSERKSDQAISCLARITSQISVRSFFIGIWFLSLFFPNPGIEEKEKSAVIKSGYKSKRNCRWPVKEKQSSKKVWAQRRIRFQIWNENIITAFLSGFKLGRDVTKKKSWNRCILAAVQFAPRFYLYFLSTGSSLDSFFLILHSQVLGLQSSFQTLFLHLIFHFSIYYLLFHL